MLLAEAARLPYLLCSANESASKAAIPCVDAAINATVFVDNSASIFQRGSPAREAVDAARGNDTPPTHFFAFRASYTTPLSLTRQRPFYCHKCDYLCSYVLPQDGLRLAQPNIKIRHAKPADCSLCIVRVYLECSLFRAPIPLANAPASPTRPRPMDGPRAPGESSP